MKTKTVARWYPDAKDITYRDEEADEARERNKDLVLVPNVAEVAALRRSKFWLTERGLDIINSIKEKVAQRLHVSPYAVTHSYSKNAGCRMCPCSPGYLIKVDASKVGSEKTNYEFFGTEERNWKNAQVVK